MPVTLVRKSISVDVHDADAVRAWLKESVALEIKLKGQPITQLVFLADGYEEVLDLTTAVRDDRGASMGATFQMLRRRPQVERAFAIVRAEITDKEDKEHSFALVFEEIAEPDEPRRWWMSMQEFHTDPNTELGHLIGDWKDAAYETTDINHLMPFLREFAMPPPGSRPARVLPPRATQPDIQVAMDNLPPNAPSPTTAKMMVELAGQLAVGDLLKGAVKGTVVVRYAQRVWEMWVLGGEMPTELEDMVRYIANKREPPAEGVAVAMVAIMPQDVPPVPFVQVIGEMDGKFVETRAPIEFPEGPAGPKRLREIRWWDAKPVPESGMWLGVDPNVTFDLGPLNVGEG
ncbi:MAG: hypothetical protein ACOZNI_28045 [Myxococcota bacterium]